MRVPLLFITVALFCPAWARAAAPEHFGERGAPLYISCGELFRWQQEDTTVLHLKRGVRIYQGNTALTAPEAVAWFQEKGTGDIPAGALLVYAAGAKLAINGATRTAATPGLFQSYPARGLVLNGSISAAGESLSTDSFVAAAMAFRRGEPPPQSTRVSNGMLDLLHPGAEEMSVTELQDGAAVVTLRGNAQIAGDNLLVKADTIRARVVSVETQPGKTEYRVRSVYAEGAVEMHRDTEMIVAHSLYMDLPNETGLALDARVRGHAGSRQIPVQVHADSIRQMSRYRFTLEGGGYFSPSPFAEPHYQVQGREIEMVSGSRSPEGEESKGQQSMLVASHHNLFYVGPLPVLYWPYLAKDLSNGSFLISSAEFGSSNDPGTYLRLGWDLYDLVYYSDKDSSLTLLTDYYLGHGPGIGLNFNYHTPERLGWARAYYVHDRGKFDDKDVPNPQMDRGEFTIRDREFLSERLHLDVEMGYLSDWRFLKTYDQADFDNDKDRETGLFLRDLSDNQLITLIARERINKFQDELDREALSYHLFADQVGDSPLLWTTHTDFARLRLRYDDMMDVPSSPAVGRLDTSHELSLPFMAGPVRLAPYLLEDVTAYTRSADDTEATGRLASGAGFRAGTSFYRTFDARSEWLGVDGLRHIMTPVLDFQDIFGVSKSPSSFVQSDEIDALGETTQATVGLRNRLQTHRFINNERTLVDLLTADLEYTDLMHGQPVNATPNSHADLSLTWQATDNIRFSSEDNRYNTDKGRVEAGNAEVNVNYWQPVTVGLLYKYYLDTQTKGAPEHSVVSPSLTYQPLYSRWKIEFLTSYDFKGSSGSDNSKKHALGTSLFFTRQLDDWALRFGVRFNHGAANDTVFSFSVIPPGSRRNVHPYSTTGLYY